MLYFRKGTIIIFSLNTIFSRVNSRKCRLSNIGCLWYLCYPQGLVNIFPTMLKLKLLYCLSISSIIEWNNGYNFRCFGLLDHQGEIILKRSFNFGFVLLLRCLLMNLFFNNLFRIILSVYLAKTFLGFRFGGSFEWFVLLFVFPWFMLFRHINWNNIWGGVINYIRFIVEEKEKKA